MLNEVIRFALAYRFPIVAIALALLVFGSWTIRSLSIDVLPDLTRPRVTVLTEAHGLAPEEVETLITARIEAAINGANGVESVRSSSDIGLSVVQVDFDWDSDIYIARQIVQERLASIADQLPPEVRPQLGPISSLLGQMMIVGLEAEDDQVDEMELRTLADWVVKPRLQSVSGVAQVITIGGEKKQFQVLVNPEVLLNYKLTLHEVEQALQAGNLNTTGGYINRGSEEYLVRALGRVRSKSDIEQIVIKQTTNRAITIRDVARVIEGPQVKRGDAFVNGKSAVAITITKQPGADTRAITERIEEVCAELEEALPAGMSLNTEIYRQREFIDRAVENVIEALRDGAILVIVILFLFLFNLRTTFITLMAIPLSLVVTGLIFYWMEMSINVMTLGGIAVAMGELVDDAIVDVENIFRRLKENAQLAEPKPALSVIYQASKEIRSAIVFGTMLVILVFLPLFSLSGMEGRLFTPLGIAYVTSILASLLVSLTVTPVLSYYLLPSRQKTPEEAKDSFVLRTLKWLATPWIRLSMSRVGMTLVSLASLAAIALSLVVILQLGRDFLPPFDEGAAQVNVFLPVGASLEASNRIGDVVDDRLKNLMKTEKHPEAPILNFVRRTGWAEDDEHVMGVNVSETILSLNPDSPLSREELIASLREELEEVPGIEHEVEQPIAHLLSHMLSGVTAQIAIKLYGDDLSILRSKAQEIKAAIEDIEGIAPPVVEQQSLVPQLQIDLDRNKLQLYGLRPAEVNETIETALNGRVISQVIQQQRSFALLVRFDEPYRSDYSNLDRLNVPLPNGGRVPLRSVATVRDAAGPNTIKRENVRRRITVRVNTAGRDVGSAVEEIRRTLRDEVSLPEGYHLQYEGQFQAQATATSRLLLLSVASLVGVFFVLYTLFPSARLVFQIMLALPAAFVGGVAALWITNQTLTVASMVGFISLGGIAARNGILLISHYLTLLRDEGEPFAKETILRGSLERLAPVLMTALTTGIGLVPLVIGGHLPGKELLYPVATVILGGLITSTLCEFLLRPGLFWHFSRNAAQQLVEDAAHDPLQQSAENQAQ